MMRRIAFFLAIAAMSVKSSSAHMLAPSLFDVRERGEGQVEVEWRTPVVAMPGAELRPVLPAGCSAGEPTLSITEANSVTRWPVECSPAGLVGKRFTVAGVVENRADVLLRVKLSDGRLFRTVLGADRPDFVVPEHERPLDVFASYLGLGVKHILTGFDHLLFVLGLLFLIRGTRVRFWTLTAFTLGHSVTLSLAVLGFVHIPQAPAEAAIAATIFVLSVELARPPAFSPSWLRRQPWAMAALFGLLHGLGFAGALAEIGLPEGDIPLALLSFNVGIEIGQILFVTAVLALEAVVRRAKIAWPAPARLAPAYGIGSLAAFWMLQRLAIVFGA